MERFLLKIHGKVQGVGYRWFVVEKATKYNLSGWVKNEPDGTVSCAVEGLKEDIDKFIVEIKNDHPCAKIAKIEICDLPKDFQIKEGFTIRID